MGANFRSQVIKMAFFGLKYGRGLEKKAAHPHEKNSKE